MPTLPVLKIDRTSFVYGTRIPILPVSLPVASAKISACMEFAPSYDFRRIPASPPSVRLCNLKDGKVCDDWIWKGDTGVLIPIPTLPEKPPGETQRVFDKEAVPAKEMEPRPSRSPDTSKSLLAEM